MLANSALLAGVEFHNAAPCGLVAQKLLNSKLIFGSYCHLSPRHHVQHAAIHPPSGHPDQGTCASQAGDGC